MFEPNFVKRTAVNTGEPVKLYAISQNESTRKIKCSQPFYAVHRRTHLSYHTYLQMTQVLLEVTLEHSICHQSVSGYPFLTESRGILTFNFFFPIFCSSTFSYVFNLGSESEFIMWRDFYQHSSVFSVTVFIGAAHISQGFDMREIRVAF